MSDLMIIIVIYNKKIDDIHFLKKYSNIDDEVEMFIYDNSFHKQETQLQLPKINIHYFHDASNPGVSKGYNVGFEKAKELNKKCVLLLDQDSDISYSALQQYMSLYTKYGDRYIYAPIMYGGNKIYSPAYTNNFVGKVQNFSEFKYEEQYSLKGKSIINSGMTVPLKLIDDIGSFNEKIKLDFSDFYFIEKYKMINSSIILLNLKVLHDLSGDGSHNSKAEFLRYKYYCNGLKEFNISFNKFKIFPAFRRMVRLIIKYHKLEPIQIFKSYFLGNKTI